MVYTVTFNPSLDYIVSMNDFGIGRTNRTIGEQMLPGGKGINVSIVLHNLGIESTALGFTAGFTGDQIECKVREMGLRTDFIHLEKGFSRINVKLKDYDGTEINGMGPEIGQLHVNELFRKLEKLSAGDILVLAGSIPKSLPDSIYRDILKRVWKRGVLSVVDATKDLLLNVLAYQPFLIKPNNHELGELFGVTLKTREAVIPYAKKLQEKGARNVLVSMSGQGAVLLDEDGIVHMLAAPEGTLVNAVGAGDSMVAGFVAGWTRTQDYEYAFRMGVSAGSASAFSELLATGQEIEQIFGKIKSGAALAGRRYLGKTACGGIAMGKVMVFGGDQGPIKPVRIEEPSRECSRVRHAADAAKQQLVALYDKAVAEVGESGAAIFVAHQMMLEDEVYLDAVDRLIQTELVNAEYAVEATGEQFAGMLAVMEDADMQARAADIRDVSARLVRNLSGNGGADCFVKEPSIIVAEDLTPGEIIQMDRDKILAFVTVHGSASSHTAILARMMGIPALVGVEMDLGLIRTGMTAIVDGDTGEVIFEPTKLQCSAAEKRLGAEREKRRLLQALKGRKNETSDGRTIEIYANISSVSDVDGVLENDAGGIGLFRSEFLYLERSDFPSEEEQFQAYRQVLQRMGNRKVVIRTLDIGADKQADYFGLGEEDNPALGCRAIRICLLQPWIFKTQLRALFRAAVYGNLAIMYPMIISTEEVLRIYDIVREVAEELEKAQLPYRIPEQGIMIETPAAVMISDELAELVDFFSIGTNDLTQYTLAIDRQNQRLADFYNPHHKALLRMIRTVVDNAHRCGKRAGICGDLGADIALVPAFVDMGVDELSVAPSMVLKVRERVRAM